MSDWLKVVWSSAQYIDFTYLTTFTMTFQSDVEGQILLPPSSLNTLVLETGNLQEFRIPSGAFNLTVGMQSDIDVASVPDGGSTIALLSAGFGLIAVVRGRLR